MAVGGFDNLFFQDLEFLFNVLPQALPAHLYRHFVQNLLVVIEQRAKIDPVPVFLNAVMDCVYIVKYIIRCVYEKTCGHTLIFFRWVTIAIKLCELPRHHREIWVFRDDFHCRFIWNLDRSEGILVIFIARKRMDKWKNLDLSLLLNTIQNKVGPEEHEICDLVALSSKTRLHQIKHQPTQPTSRHQNLSPFVYILLNFFHYPFGVLSLFTLPRPLPVELFYRGSHLRNVDTLARRCLGFRKIRWLLLLHRLDDQVEEGLVCLDRPVQFLSLLFPEEFIVLIQFGLLVEFVVLATRVLRVVQEAVDNLLAMVILLLTGLKGRL